MPRMGLRIRLEVIRKATLAMSVATYTPVPYWLSMPLAELARWVEDFLQMQKEARASR